MNHICWVRQGKPRADGEAPGYGVFARPALPEYLKSAFAWSSAAIVADDTTNALFCGDVEALLREHCDNVTRHTFEPGEARKSRATKARIEDEMLAARHGRRCLLVAVGGGIPLDIGGFVAATYMRGIDHLNIATTLLAQVDAAIGGKTAINVAFGKNLVGAMHAPIAVAIDFEALASLPAHEVRQGLAEAVKHGALADAGLFDDLAQGRQSIHLPQKLVERCITIKADVVARDSLEQGERTRLNFGHTVAHAIEIASNHGVAHGDAVAVGMVVEARLMTKRGTFPGDDFKRLVACLASLGLPTSAPCDFDAVAANFSLDKKNTDGAIRVSVPPRIGDASPRPEGWTSAVTLAELRGAWRETDALLHR